MRILLTILSIFCCGNIIFSQNVNLKRVEEELILEFENYIKSDYERRYDSLRAKLKKQVENVLSNPESFDYSFDSLAEYVTIIKSIDEKVRIFSWDELTGGTWHDMAVIVQFKTKSKKINTKWIDSDISEETSGITDAIQYEINNVYIENKTHYLCFGSGTYGSGNHHNSILIFSVVNESFEPCSSCIPEDYSIIQAPRGEKINMSYDKQKQEISFNEFNFNDDVGFFEPTGERIKLKLKVGKFSD